MKVGSIETREPFSILFPVDRVTLEAISRDMNENGYDEAQPLVLWGSVVVDGHTRLEAARMAGLDDVPTVSKEFEDEDEALAYAIHVQRDRRNLTDADIVRLVAQLDKRRAHGGDRRSGDFKAQPCALKKSAEETAAIVGVSTRKVEQARAVLDSAATEVKQAVMDGEKSINSAYQETRKQKGASKRPDTFKAPEQEEAWYEKQDKPKQHKGKGKDAIAARGSVAQAIESISAIEALALPNADRPEIIAMLEKLKATVEKTIKTVRKMK